MQSTSTWTGCSGLGTIRKSESEPPWALTPSAPRHSSVSVGSSSRAPSPWRVAPDTAWPSRAMGRPGPGATTATGSWGTERPRTAPARCRRCSRSVPFTAGAGLSVTRDGRATVRSQQSGQITWVERRAGARPCWIGCQTVAPASPDARLAQERTAPCLAMLRGLSP
jgi:hypothetical protein